MIPSVFMIFSVYKLNQYGEKRLQWFTEVLEMCKYNNLNGGFRL